MDVRGYEIPTGFVLKAAVPLDNRSVFSTTVDRDNFTESNGAVLYKGLTATVQSENALYIWSGTSWVKLIGAGDLDSLISTDREIKSSVQATEVKIAAVDSKVTELKNKTSRFTVNFTSQDLADSPRSTSINTFGNDTLTINNLYEITEVRGGDYIRLPSKGTVDSLAEYLTGYGLYGYYATGDVVGETFHIGGPVEINHVFTKIGTNLILLNSTSKDDYGLKVQLPSDRLDSNEFVVVIQGSRWTYLDFKVPPRVKITTSAEVQYVTPGVWFTPPSIGDLTINSLSHMNKNGIRLSDSSGADLTGLLENGVLKGPFKDPNLQLIFSKII